MSKYVKKCNLIIINIIIINNSTTSVHTVCTVLYTAIERIIFRTVSFKVRGNEGPRKVAGKIKNKKKIKKTM